MGSALPIPLEFSPEVLEGVVAAYSTRESVEALIDGMMTAKPLSFEDREQVIFDSLRGAPQAKEAWPRSTGQEDISAEVTAINVPTLAIYGELDKVHTVASAKTDLIPRIEGARLEILPGVGHLSPLEAPGALAKIIDQFAGGSLDEYEYRSHSKRTLSFSHYNRRNLEHSLGYSQAVLAGQALFVSGCVSWDMEGQPMHVGDFDAQLEAAYADIDATLRAHGMTTADIVKETVYTTDMDALVSANPKRMKYYEAVPAPASTWVEIRRLVHPDLLVEIEITALKSV